MKDPKALKHDIAGLFAWAELSAHDTEALALVESLWAKVKDRLDEEDPAFMRAPDTLDLLGGAGEQS